MVYTLKRGDIKVVAIPGDLDLSEPVGRAAFVQSPPSLWGYTEEDGWVELASLAGATIPPLGNHNLYSTSHPDVDTARANNDLLVWRTSNSKYNHLGIAALHGEVFHLAQNALSGSAPLSSYPVGTSVMEVTTASTGWPVAATAYNVVTFRTSSTQGFQIAKRIGVVGERYMRTWNSAGPAWLAWDRMDPVASATVSGLVELADTTETRTGTDATRAVTPASLEGARPTNAYVELTRTTAQSISDSLLTDIIWNSETRDPRNWRNGTNPERITPDIPGWYQVSLYGLWTSNATGVRRQRILRNGSLLAQDSVIPPTGNAGAPQTTSFQMFMNGTTDYITCDVLQASGAALDLSVNTTFTMSLVR